MCARVEKDVRRTRIDGRYWKRLLIGGRLVQWIVSGRCRSLTLQVSNKARSFGHGMYFAGVRSSSLRQEAKKPVRRNRQIQPLPQCRTRQPTLSLFVWADSEISHQVVPARTISTRSEIVNITIIIRKLHSFIMKLQLLFFVLGLLAIAVSAVTTQKAVIVSYPKDTPNSVVDQAMDAVRDAVSLMSGMILLSPIVELICMRLCRVASSHMSIVSTPATLCIYPSLTRISTALFK